MVAKSVLLRELPAYRGLSELISSEQQVRDIIKEILNSHQLFASHYDKICEHFDASNPVVTAKRLYGFCKRNIAYRIEPRDKQTTKAPAAILAQGQGDCKHYALFIAGVLDALRRRR